jgi:photosystem II stability/assembly factor-like uncharacterized protein
LNRATSTLHFKVLAVVVALAIAALGVVLVARQALAPGRAILPSASSVASPSPTAIPMPTWAQLSAPSTEVVWVFVADTVVFRSMDRGATWEQRSLPSTHGGGRPAEISFVDANQGWYSTGGSPETQCNAAGTEIWRTKDGAANWQQVAVVPGSSGIADSQCKEGLSFIDPANGFLAASDPNHRPTIYRTSDGGRTWTGANLPDPPGFITQPGGFSLHAGLVKGFGGTLLVPAWGMQDGDQVTTEYAYRSIDGGTTWTYLARTRDGINNVTFVSASRWLELITPGQSVETTDSGKTWHSYPSEYSQAAPVAPQIVFGDPLVGYATVRGSIQRTIDGGVHWTYLKTPGT